MTLFYIVLWSFLALVLYSYVRARVATVIQPMRLEVLAKAQTLLKRADFPENKKRTVNFLLDNIYSTKAAWFFALLVLPMAVYMTVKRLFRSGVVVRQNIPHRKDYQEVLRLGVLCMVSSSPAAFLVFFFASLMAELLRFPASAGITKLLDKAKPDGHKHKLSSFPG